MAWICARVWLAVSWQVMALGAAGVDAIVAEPVRASIREARQRQPVRLPLQNNRRPYSYIAFEERSIIDSFALG
jgi:hypothetical protein